MNKPITKMIRVVLILFLLGGMSFFAYASTVFFSENASGFSCYGTGDLTSTHASAYFSASPLVGTPIQPAEMYSSYITVTAAYDIQGLSGTIYSQQGNLTCVLSAYPNANNTYAYAYYDYAFQANYWQGFVLYN